MIDDGASRADAAHSTPADRVFDRRAALRLAMRGGAAVTLGAGIPSVLAACGTKTAGPPKDRYFYVGYATSGPGSPPLGDLISLVARRAADRDVSPLLPEVTGTTTYPVEALRLHVGYSALRDEKTGMHPLAFKVVVAGLPDLRAVAPIAASAVKIGVKVVAYLVDTRPRTAAITVDPAQMGSMLGEHAATWARQRLGGRGSALILLPAGDHLLLSGAETLFGPLATQGMDVLRQTLARREPGVKVTVAKLAASQTIEGALGAHPSARVVLCWNDGLAAAVARVLRARHPGSRAGWYVGALGTPALASRSVIKELRRGDPLRAIVAARPRDLANALVDLPANLLDGEPARDIKVIPQLLTPDSAALAAHARDYGPNPKALVGKLAEAGLEKTRDGVTIDPSGGNAVLVNPADDPRYDNPARTATTGV